MLVHFRGFQLTFSTVVALTPKTMLSGRRRYQLPNTSFTTSETREMTTGWSSGCHGHSKLDAGRQVRISPDTCMALLKGTTVVVSSVCPLGQVMGSSYLLQREPGTTVKKF